MALYSRDAALLSFVTHSRAYATPSQHIYDPWWQIEVALSVRLKIFLLVTKRECSITPRNFAAAHRVDSCRMHSCCDTYTFLLIFAQIDLISSIFRRFIAAIHTTFGGDTYTFLGSNAALWPRKHPLRTMRFELAIETSIPATILCRHNHDAWQQALCVMNPVNALFWLRIHRILRPLGDSCISV